MPRALRSGVSSGNWLCWETIGARRCRAEALGCLAKPRIGVGYQIGYLRLTVALLALAVNPTPIKIHPEGSLFRFGEFGTWVRNPSRSSVPLRRIDRPSRYPESSGLQSKTRGHFEFSFPLMFVTTRPRGTFIEHPISSPMQQMPDWVKAIPNLLNNFGVVRRLPSVESYKGKISSSSPTLATL